MTKKLMLLLSILIIISAITIPTYAFSSTIDYSGYWVENSIHEWIIDAVETLNRTIQNFKISHLTNDVSQPTDKTIRILTIGNSFSQDVDYYLYDIAKSAGINVIVGNLYYSGCSLERHWKYALNNEETYSYYKWKSDEMTLTENCTIKEAILDEKWDYITFQQSSGNSGMYSTYQPYLSKLLTYVKGITKNPNVKFALNMTWAYSSQSTNDGFFFYHHNQKTMYNAIVNSYKYASDETGISLIIPCGTAIQNARTNKYLNAVGKELTSDGYHLDTGIGRYIAGLTMFKTILNEERIELDLKDVTFIPNSEVNTENLASLAKKAAKGAIIRPFEVTTISAKTYEH